MEFESAVKKNLWIFFQKYSFIRKIESYHLRIKHIIQMTSTAGLTVPYSINPIFQYIFNFLGKRPIRSMSKIVAFGAQKIQTSSLRSRCTHNEWLFGADFGTVTSLGHFSSKISKEIPLRSMVSVTVPYSQRNNRSFAHRPSNREFVMNDLWHYLFQKTDCAIRREVGHRVIVSWQRNMIYKFVINI